jgi:hypothetical protein
MALLAKGWRFPTLLLAFAIGFVAMAIAFMNWGYIF